LMGGTEPWTLADGEKLNREHPRSFFIPSRERRDRLVIGEDVKLAFETPDGRSERMWVTITKAESPRFSGVLANVPTIIDLAIGVRVEFEARHIIAIEEDPEVLGCRPDEQAAASRRVIERDQAPNVVAWEPGASCFYLFAGNETEAEVRDSGGGESPCDRSGSSPPSSSPPPWPSPAAPPAAPTRPPHRRPQPRPRPP
jgi:hypothetical protein